jgi:hypothetical protein
MPKDRRQHREPNSTDPDGLAVWFLLTELDLANTFLEIARTSDRVEMKVRNIANAWKAHDAVVHLASRIGLTDSELLEITERLRAIKARLVEMRTPDAK